MKTIGIHAPRDTSSGCERTLQALASALGVQVSRRSLINDRGVDGWIVLGVDLELLATIKRAGKPCYVVINEAQSVACGRTAALTFTNGPDVEPVLRGREVAAEDAIDAKALPGWLTRVTPLALKNGSAVWAIGEGAGGGRHHYVSLLVPELDEGEPVYTRLSGRQIAQLLPLVLFLRSVKDEGEAWEYPPLQASFMFDDPNLHWPSYGFIDYDELVAHADCHNYHVSIATIPLDTWYVHDATSAIFRNNRTRISLLYHGNDHLYRELSRYHSNAEIKALLEQAVHRMSRLEARARLDVARVMAPPHGACNETALAGMARSGFEAACVSRGSLRFHNPGAVWIKSMGFKPCERILGLPVIPRFGLNTGCTNDILLAAVLRQPIVPMTHHQAVAESYDLLDNTAGFINSLGPVQWRDMRTITRSLYRWRREASSLSIEMFSRRMSIDVPRDTGWLRVLPGDSDSRMEVLEWRRADGVDGWHQAPWTEPIAVSAGERLELRGSSLVREDAFNAARSRSGVVSILRRAMTEGRDRVLPSVRPLRRIAGRKAN